MTAESKRTGARVILGFVFAANGMVFLLTGHGPLGAAMLGVGLGWMIGAADRPARARRVGMATGHAPVGAVEATGTDTAPAVSPQNAR